jgi:hypothetical protein
MTQCWGSGIRCLFDPDPGSGSGMNNPGSYFRELRNQFFGVKTLKFFDADPGWKKFGSGMEKIWIRDGKNSDPEH